MSSYETNDSFWKMAAGVAAEDTRMVKAVQWMFYGSGRVSPAAVEVVADSIADVCETYGLEQNTDACGAAVQQCEESVRKELFG
jgi:protein-disulfide isomerase-like protein with CxxC motif